MWSAPPGPPGPATSAAMRSDEQLEHEATGGVEAAVDVDGADDRLQGVGQDRGLLPAAAGGLALAEPEGVADAELGGHGGEGGLR